MDKAEPSVEPTTAMPAIKIGLYAAFTRVGRTGTEPACKPAAFGSEGTPVGTPLPSRMDTCERY
jgi:hypothetical protein